MREIRLYGSEGGELKSFPTPISISTMFWIVRSSRTMTKFKFLDKPPSPFQGEVRRGTGKIAISSPFPSLPRRGFISAYAFQCRITFNFPEKRE